MKDWERMDAAIGAPAKEEMDPAQKTVFISKIDLINRVSNAICGRDLNGIPRAGSGISEVAYEIYDMEEHGYQEYLVVTYFGGGIAVRNCNINSHSAILRELGKLLDGGYYDEVKGYLECQKKYKRIFLTHDEICDKI